MSDTPGRSTHLMAEVDAASSLLHRARGLWTSYTYAGNDAEPLMVLLATGTEKLLKLTFGLLREHLDGEWPPIKSMSTGGYGHNIARLDADLRELLREHSGRATYPQQIVGLLDQVEADPHITNLLQTLTSYGMSGRFHNLDNLFTGGRPTISPSELWREMNTAATLTNPLLHEAIFDTETSEKLRHQTNQALLSSQTKWQELYARTWAQGVCGPEVRAYWHQLRPRG